MVGWLQNWRRIYKALDKLPYPPLRPAVAMECGQLYSCLGITWVATWWGHVSLIGGELATQQGMIWARCHWRR